MTTVTVKSGYEPTVTTAVKSGYEPTVTVTPYGGLQVVSLQPAAGIDTYMASITPDNNLGTATSIFAGVMGAFILRGLLKFDLSSIPSTALIDSVTLSLWQATLTVATTNTVGLYRSLRDWAELQATYNIYSTGNSWQTAGGFGALDAEQTTVGTRAFATGEANGEKQFTITASSVQDWIDGDSNNYGWLIKMVTESADVVSFRSSDYTTAANRPKLTIGYRVPE